MNMTNPMLSLTWAERSEYARLNRAMSAFIAALELDRKGLIFDPELKAARAKNSDEVFDETMRPSTEDFFRGNELWWKAFGSQPAADASSS